MKLAAQNNKQENWPREAYSRDYKCWLGANNTGRAVPSDQVTSTTIELTRVSPGDMTVKEIWTTV